MKWLPLCSLLLVLSFSFSLSACGGDDHPDMSVPDGGDAGADGGGPDAGGSCGTALPTPFFATTNIGTTVGVDRAFYVALTTTYCKDVMVSFTLAAPGIVSMPATATIARGATRATISVTGVAVGHTTLTATSAADGLTQTGMLEIYVTDTTVPACSGTTSGMVMPGTTLMTASGSIELAAGAANSDGDNVYWHVDPFSATIDCGTDQLPTGFRALGPAVAFGPGHVRVARDMRLTIPLRMALMPAGTNRSHVLVSYTGPGATTPRIVPVASEVFGGDAEAGTLTFGAPRLGTYQAVVDTTAGTSRHRSFKFKAITGISMGAMGSSWIGFGHPDRFDMVAPMGGPTDYVTMIEYFGRYKFGGFCTSAQRATLGDAACASANNAHIQQMPQLYGHVEDFEHFYYQDEYGGQGGAFDRRDWASSLFPDTAYAWGNIATDASDDPMDPNILPVGVPDSFRTMPDSVRCPNPVILPAFYDDEYNPDGTYDAMTFCDGAEVAMPAFPHGVDDGVWDPAGSNNTYFQILLAIDYNGNHVRDPGEPVVRNTREPFYDVGLDGIADAMEPGYDAVTNPDPNGDDYDFAYNPGGTENNFYRDGDPCVPGATDVAEPFDDFGLDGIDTTPQLATGGYDRGEGNGCWDTTHGYANVVSHSRQAIENMTADQLQNLAVFCDGGIRDLLNSLVSMHGLAGDLQVRNRYVHVYDGHSSLNYSGHTADLDFDSAGTSWAETGSNVLVRYGQPDADLATKVNGDGGHVGTADQALARIQAAFYWMSAHWPDGDYTNQRGVSIGIDDLTFTDSHGRAGAVGITLPPGYGSPENMGRHYPVVYFLHGYGMDPAGLVATGALTGTYMGSGGGVPETRMQKMIVVFPDGQCHGSECVQGSFYADAPPSSPGGAQNETWLLELMDYIDANYRTKAAADFDVVE